MYRRETDRLRERERDEESGREPADMGEMKREGQCECSTKLEAESNPTPFLLLPPR